MTIALVEVHFSHEAEPPGGGSSTGKRSWLAIVVAGADAADNATDEMEEYVSSSFMADRSFWGL
ncbi:hypothetical protein ACWCXK_05745 [Streptomyces sp. NPDC001739]